MADISVVIPTCDRPGLLFVALQSVQAQTKQPVEIIVVDNGITPVLPDQLPRNVILERLPPRVGVSRARNAGARKASGTYIAFLDDDDTWEPAYLEHMAGAIGCALTRPDLLLGRVDVNRDGKRVVFKCVTSAKTLMPRLLYGNPGVMGSNIVVRRQKFHQIGGFDETFAGSEDRALALEFWEADSQIVTVPSATAVSNRTHGGPQLTDAPIAGKQRFIAKYRRLMSIDEWLSAHAQVLIIRAHNNGMYWPLMMGVQFLRRFVSQLPEGYRNMLSRYARAGALDFSS